MAGQNEILSTSIGIEADVSSVIAAVQEARTAVEELGSSSDNSSRRVNAAIGAVETELGKLIVKLNGVKQNTNETVDFMSKSWGTAKEAVSQYVAELDKIQPVTVGVQNQTTEVKKNTKGIATQFGAAAGKAGLALAAVTGVVKAYNAVADYVRSGETIATLFSLEQEGKDPKAKLDAFNQKLIEVGAELNKINSSPLNPLGRSKKQIIEELEALRKQQLSLSQQIKAQRIADAKEVAAEEKRLASEKDNSDLANADAFRQRLFETARDARISMLPNVAQVSAMTDVVKGDLVRAATAMGIAYKDEVLQATLEAIEAQAVAEIARIREQERLKDEAQSKRDKESAERQIEAARKMGEAFANELNGSTSNMTTMLSTIVTEIRENTSAMSRGR